MFQRKSKQHCQTDLTCKHCCSCAMRNRLLLQNREKNFQNMRFKLQSDMKSLKNANEFLVKEVEKFKKMKKEMDNMENLKEKIKEGLRKQIEEENKVQNAMNQQKMNYLVHQNTKLQQTIEKMSKNNQNLQRQLQQLNEQYGKLNQEAQIIAFKNEEMKKIIQQQTIKIEEYEDEVENKKKQINEKTSLIQKLEGIMNDLQSRFCEQRTKASDYEVQNKRLSLNIKSREQYIQDLTKTNYESAKNVFNLQNCNKKLKNLVGNLDIENASYKLNEEYLKDRVVESENIAAFNTQKVEMMKTDLYNLKLRI